MLIVACTLIGLIAVIGISGNLYVDSLLNKTNRSKKLTDEEALVNQEVKDQVQDHKIVNIALFGSDNQIGTSGLTLKCSGPTRQRLSL